MLEKDRRFAKGEWSVLIKVRAKGSDALQHVFIATIYNESMGKQASSDGFLLVLVCLFLNQTPSIYK